MLKKVSIIFGIIVQHFSLLLTLKELLAYSQALFMRVKLYRILCLWGGGNDTHNEKFFFFLMAVDCPCTDKELIDSLWEKFSFIF